MLLSRVQGFLDNNQVYFLLDFLSPHVEWFFCATFKLFVWASKKKKKRKYVKTEKKEEAAKQLFNK